MKSQDFVKIDDNIIHYDVRMYEITEKTLLEDVQKLKDWMQTQPHLPEILAYCTILPRLTHHMYRVFAFKMRNKDLIDKMEPHNAMGLLHNIQELRLKEDVMFGDIVILDMKGINMGYLAKTDAVNSL
jgi:hypothetical protein